MSLASQNSVTSVRAASQFGDQVVLGPDGGVDAGCGAVGAVDGEGPLQVPEHAHVVDDETVVLVGEHPVGAGDGLHQQVVAHRFVEIHRRRRRRVEPGEPHGAYETPAGNGSSGSLNLESRSSSSIRLRCLAMSSPAAAMSATSFWAWDTTTAHVGAVHELDQ